MALQSARHAPERPCSRAPVLQSARAPERPCSRLQGLQASRESQCRDGRCIPDSHTARRTPGGLGSGNYSASAYVGPSARAARRTPRVAQSPVLAGDTCAVAAGPSRPVLCGVCVRACARAWCVLHVDGWCRPDFVCGWELSITAPHTHLTSHTSTTKSPESHRAAESAPV